MTNNQKNKDKLKNKEFITIVNKKGYLISMTMKEAEEKGIVKSEEISKKWGISNDKW